MARIKDIQIPGSVKECKFYPGNPRDFSTALRIFDGQQVVLTMGIPKKIRTSPQHRYLFGGVYKKIAEHMYGIYTDEDLKNIHQAFKEMFLAIDSPDDLPLKITRTKSTTKLSTVEFIDYYRKIIQYAAQELSLFIPEPNEEEMWHALSEEIDRRCQSKPRS